MLGFHCSKDKVKEVLQTFRKDSSGVRTTVRGKVVQFRTFDASIFEICNFLLQELPGTLQDLTVIFAEVRWSIESALDFINRTEVSS